MIKDFITIAPFTPRQLEKLLDRAIADKALFKAGKLPVSLPNRTLAMVFEKPSLRTRVSFEVAMTHLGGHAIHLTQADIGLGKRESVQDIARVLGRMCNGIMARTFSHALVEQLAQYAQSPVINGLTDNSHPCQAMSDMMTARELLGDVKGKTLVFIGDGNNVARSLAMACAKLGMKFVLACPEGYELDAPSVAAVRQAGGEKAYACMHQPEEAVAGADVLYTDTWVSMHQEHERHERMADFKQFQINTQLLTAARPNVIVMHDLPAYRGCEITDDAFEAHASTIFQEAENRLHFQRSLLNVLLGEGGIA